jgi:allantoicase
MNETGEHAGAMLIDLAAERVGGQALLASDEFFAEKENLLKPGRGVFIPDKFTDRGKWMDGWETRRKRTPGHDWCIIRLGLSGVIKTVDIDTNHFLGNHPPFASLDGACIDNSVSVDALANNASFWTEVLPKSPLNPGSQNVFEIAGSKRWTHIRLNIYPDGGVARLRIYGDVIPDWSKYKTNDLIDLAAVENGGVIISTSDMFFGSGQNMIMPGSAANMGDGWETKRRRGPGHDWAVIKLGRPGTIKKIEVDTKHFKGNHPDECSIEGCYTPIGSRVESLTSPLAHWDVLLPKMKLQPDTRHFFEKDLKDIGECTHVRLNIFPDGGVSRFRVWGMLRG